MVKTCNRGKKGKNMENTPETLAQINLTPKLYAGATAAATETHQNTSSQKQLTSYCRSPRLPSSDTEDILTSSWKDRST
jgi:hypothetical protein